MSTQLEPSPSLAADALIGRSRVMQDFKRDLVTVARSGAPTVLIVGETGTGKDLAARILHGEGARAAGPFVAVNCAAIPATLAEDLFFGHDPGAFTDARVGRAGLIEEAQGGTVFLDEIGDLNLGLQGKLLRIFEDRRVRRLGGKDERTVDVRIVAATQVDLELAVAAGRFRSDLYHRLDLLTLRLPALRERGPDIQLLAEHFLALAEERYGRQFSGFDESARAAIEAHTWPGNVRQLAHAVERAVVLGHGDAITASMLRIDAPRHAPEPRATSPTPGIRAKAFDHVSVGSPDELKDAELIALVRALERSDGSLTDAAALLGVTRDTVRQRMRRHGVRIRSRIELGERRSGSGPHDEPAA